MSQTADDGSDKKRSSAEVVDEKHPEQVDVISVRDGDEALKLVGMERTAEFSEEFNRKLRRKLVSRS